MRAGVRALRWAAGGALTLLVAVYLLLPLGLRTYLPAAAREAGVTLTVGTVVVQPFARTVELGDLAIDTGAGVSIAVDRAVAAVDLAALAGGRLRIDALRVKGLRLAESAARPSGGGTGSSGGVAGGTTPDVGSVVLESVSVPIPGTKGAIIARRIRIADLRALFAGTPTEFAVDATFGGGDAHVEGTAALVDGRVRGQADVVADSVDAAAVGARFEGLEKLAGKLGARATVTADVALDGASTGAVVEGTLRTDGLRFALGGRAVDEVTGVWRGRAELGGKGGQGWHVGGSTEISRLAVHASGVSASASDVRAEGRIESGATTPAFHGKVSAATIEAAVPGGWHVSVEDARAGKVAGKGGEASIEDLAAGAATATRGKGKDAVELDLNHLEGARVALGPRGTEASGLGAAGASLSAPALAGGLDVEGVELRVDALAAGDKVTIGAAHATRLSVRAAAGTADIDAPRFTGLSLAESPRLAKFEAAAIDLAGTAGTSRAEEVRLGGVSRDGNGAAADSLDLGRLTVHDATGRNAILRDVHAEKVVVPGEGVRVSRLEASGLDGDDGAGRQIRLSTIALDHLAVDASGHAASDALSVGRASFDAGSITVSARELEVAGPRVDDRALRTKSATAAGLEVAGETVPSISASGLDAAGLTVGSDGAVESTGVGVYEVAIATGDSRFTFSGISATPLARSAAGVVSVRSAQANSASALEGGAPLARSAAWSLDGIEVDAGGGFRISGGRIDALAGNAGPSAWRVAELAGTGIEGGTGVKVRSVDLGAIEVAEGDSGPRIDAKSATLSGLALADGALAIAGITIDGPAVAVDAGGEIGASRANKLAVERVRVADGTTLLGQVRASGVRVALGVTKDGAWVVPRLPALGGDGGAIAIEDAALDGSGRVVFSDLRLGTGHRTEYTVSRATLTGLDSATVGARAPFHIEAARNKFSTQKVDGSLITRLGGFDLETRGEVRGLDLASLSPYAERHLGLDVTGGRADVDFDFTLTDGDLDGNSHVTVSRLKLKANAKAALSPGAVATGASLRATLPMLTDKEGTLKLDIGFSGSTDDPQFGFGDLYAKALANTAKSALMLYLQPIGLALAAKDLLLGDLVGASLRPLSFEPGSAKLGAESLTYLDEVAKRLRDRPALVVRVCGFAVDADTAPLARAVAQAASQGTAATVRTLADLAEARARAAREYLLAKHLIPAAQIERCKDTPATGGDGAPRVELELAGNAPAPVPAAPRSSAPAH